MNDKIPVRVCHVCKQRFFQYEESPMYPDECIQCYDDSITVRSKKEIIDFDRPPRTWDAVGYRDFDNHPVDYRHPRHEQYCYEDE